MADECIDVYLRAASEEEAKAALPDFVNAAGDWIVFSAHGYDLVPLGAIVDAPAEIDAEGAVMADATFKPGWHVNVYVTDPAWLAPLDASGLRIAAPAQPALVRAGRTEPQQPGEAPEGGEG